MYDKPNNESFISKLERVQLKACLAIKGVTQGTSHERLYKELGPEFLIDRRWVREFTFFYKIVTGKSPRYFLNFLKINNNSVVNIKYFQDEN